MTKKGGGEHKVSFTKRHTQNNAHFSTKERRIILSIKFELGYMMCYFILCSWFAPKCNLKIVLSKIKGGQYIDFISSCILFDMFNFL